MSSLRRVQLRKHSSFVRVVVIGAVRIDAKLRQYIGTLGIFTARNLIAHGLTFQWNYCGEPMVLTSRHRRDRLCT